VGRIQIGIFPLQLSNLLFQFLHLLVNPDGIIHQLRLLGLHLIYFTLHFPVFNGQVFILSHQVISFLLNLILIA